MGKSLDIILHRGHVLGLHRCLLPCNPIKYGDFRNKTQFQGIQLDIVGEDRIHRRYQRLCGYKLEVVHILFLDQLVRNNEVRDHRTQQGRIHHKDLRSYRHLLEHKHPAQDNRFLGKDQYILAHPLHTQPWLKGDIHCLLRRDKDLRLHFMIFIKSVFYNLLIKNQSRYIVIH